MLLPGGDSTAYTDVDVILKIAKDKGADAIHPGYGFLSENASFAFQVQEAGIGWVGPSSKAIDAFGIKHVARDLAEKAGVPIVPGTKGLVDSEEAAAKAANGLGLPVMLKATGGGGGLGLVTCHNEKQVRNGFKTTTSRGQTLFRNAGVFIEKYYPHSRHVEIQIFGNGQGKAIHFGERECSIQRRHQKVIEECPSPFVTQHAALRDKLGSAAVSLAESVKYASAGTVEFLVDDRTGDAFFLEMNTRLQVEHGITELCYGVDIVELMLKQMDAQLAGKGGLDVDFLSALRAKHSEPQGAAIECRVYAENPIRGFAPSPGLLQEVRWADVAGSRVDTWVSTGTPISSFYGKRSDILRWHLVLSHQTMAADASRIRRDSQKSFVDSNLFISSSALASCPRNLTSSRPSHRKSDVPCPDPPPRYLWYAQNTVDLRHLRPTKQSRLPH